MDSRTFMPPFREELDGMHVYTHLRTALLYLKNISICHGLFSQAEADVDGSTWKHTKEVLHGSHRTSCGESFSDQLVFWIPQERNERHDTEY